MPFGDMISTTTGASCVLPPSITAGLMRTFSGRAREQTAPPSPPPPWRSLPSAGGTPCPLWAGLSVALSPAPLPLPRLSGEQSAGAPCPSLLPPGPVPCLLSRGQVAKPVCAAGSAAFHRGAKLARVIFTAFLKF